MNIIHLPPAEGANGYEPGPEIQGHSGTLYWPHEKAAPEMGSVVEGDDGVMYYVYLWLPGQSRVDVLDEGVEVCDAVLQVAVGSDVAAAVCRAYIHDSPFAGKSSGGSLCPATAILKEAVRRDNIRSDGWNPQIPDEHCLPHHPQYEYVRRRMLRKGWIKENGTLDESLWRSGGF